MMKAMESRDRIMSEAAARLDQYDKPQLAVAKQWHDTVILPRRRWDPKSSTWHMVEMGEDPSGSELFPVWGTKLGDLNKFGIGIGLYFRLLLQQGLLMFVLAAVSVPSIRYFLSDEYSGPLEERRYNNRTVDIRLWGSAVCTPTKGYEHADSRDDCPINPLQFYVDFVVLAILCLFTLVSGYYQRAAQKFIDEQEQTAADYAVVVKDPDADAWDPDEWQQFFSQFGPVKFVTVAVDNHELLSSLAHLRYMEEMLRMESPDHDLTEQALHQAKHGPLPTEAVMIPHLKRLAQKFGVFRDLAYWQRQVYHERKFIETLVQTKTYRVWSIFVMFDTEEAQRRCLRETTAGLFWTALDPMRSVVPEHLRFRGTNTLHIEPAVEPTSVQWKNVGVRWIQRFSQQFMNLVLVAGLMVGVYYFMLELKTRFIDGGDTSSTDSSIVTHRRQNQYIMAYALCFTDIFGCKVLHYANFLEQHQTKEREQLSTLNKLLIYRVFNGAIVVYLLMDFTDMLSPSNLLQIQAILIANLTTTPLLQLLSIFDRVTRWIYGPKAKTQKKLNQYYSGTYWQLAERYTEVTKIVGIALFYKPILPTGVLITSLSLFVNYWIDKFCLLRKWKVPPKYDGLLARSSRYHMLGIAVTSLVMMGHWYDGWPFDTRTEQSVLEARHTNRSHMNSTLYNLLALVFPFPRPYHSDVKRDMMRTLCSLILVLTALAVVAVTVVTLRNACHRYVVGHHHGSSTSVSSIRASQVKGLHAYVPSYESWYSDFPYLCVPLDQFAARFVSWSGDHASYCLVNDVIEDSVLSQFIGERPLEQLFGACKQFAVPDDKPQDESGAILTQYNEVTLV